MNRIFISFGIAQKNDTARTGLCTYSMSVATLDELYHAARAMNSVCNYTQLYAQVSQTICSSILRGIQRMLTLPYGDKRIMIICILIRNQLNRLQEMPDSIEYTCDIGRMSHLLDHIMLTSYAISNVEELRSVVEAFHIKMQCKLWQSTTFYGAKKCC